VQTEGVLQIERPKERDCEDAWGHLKEIASEFVSLIREKKKKRNGRDTGWTKRGNISSTGTSPLQVTETRVVIASTKKKGIRKRERKKGG